MNAYEVISDRCDLIDYYNQDSVQKIFYQDRCCIIFQFAWRDTLALVSFHLSSEAVALETAMNLKTIMLSEPPQLKTYLQPILEAALLKQG